MVTHSFPSHHAGSGFTLIEVLIIVAIIVILAAIAGPDFLHMMPGIRLNNATQRIVNDIQLARMRAIATSREYRLNFDASAESYQIEEGNQSAGSNWPGTVVDQERKFNDTSNTFYQKNIDIASVLDATRSSQNPVFNPKGFCSNPSTITINIQNEIGGKKRITINLAGGIKVYDGWD